MANSKIGILSPGEMGAAVARTLVANGAGAFAALNGRSERTRGLAADSGMVNVGSIDQLVRQCDVILSILAPSAATVAAQQVAAAMRATGARPLYVDCNSIAPQNTRRAADFIVAAGARFVDGALIGSPPGGNVVARLYLAGPDAAELADLQTDQLQVKLLGADIGAASALRMCYGAFSQGILALASELLAAAERLGIEQSLRAELLETRGTTYEWLMRALPDVIPGAGRWVREMEEIALSFEAVGLTPKAFHGVADIYRWIADALAVKQSAEPPAAGLNGREIIGRLGQQ